MGKRKYFILSLLLVICALLSDHISKAYISKSTFTIAKSIAIKQIDKEQTEIESRQLLRKGDVFSYFGMFFAVSSLLCWLLSKFQHEPAWRLIPLGLLICYLLLQFMLV